MANVELSGIREKLKVKIGGELRKDQIGSQGEKIYP